MEIDLISVIPGIAVKRSFKDKKGTEKGNILFMIGNGLGHGLYIGGRESKEFIASNRFGDYMYGLRVDYEPSDCFSLGGHYLINKHDNILFNDERTVFDLNRRSYSMDLRYDSPGFRSVFMYGGGSINDDYFNTGKEDLDYSGWEAKVVIPVNERTDAALRFDNYSYTAHGSPVKTSQNNWTLGLNHNLTKDMRIQVNYVI